MQAVYNQVMRRERRYITLLCILFLVFSQSVLAAHSTQHSLINLEQCQLCTGQAQPSDLVVPLHEPVPVVCEPAVARYLSIDLVVPRRFVAFRNQRAPPVHS